MKQTFIFLISLFIAFSNSYAHEEPAKTLKEKKRKGRKTAFCFAEKNQISNFIVI